MQHTFSWWVCYGHKTKMPDVSEKNFTLHSVLFSILGLPLFGEKILPQAAASCFQLNMLYFCVLYDNIEKKNPRKS